MRESVHPPTSSSLAALQGALPAQCARSRWQRSTPDGARRINTVFAQDSFDSAIAQWRVVADQLRPKFQKLSELMDGAEADVLAYMSFPNAHRTQIHTTNPLERLHAEIKRRTDVVGIFPNAAAVTRRERRPLGSRQ